MGEYQSGIAAYEAKVLEVLGPYPEELTQEAGLFFISDTERIIPIQLTSVAFNAPSEIEMGSATAAEPAVAEAEETGITVVEVASGLTGIKSDLNFSYETGYPGLKSFLRYINEYPERMVIGSINAGFNHLTGEVNGVFTMSLYAVSGT
jgi:hypothetical protein